MHSQWNTSYLPARSSNVPFYAKSTPPSTYRPSAFSVGEGYPGRTQPSRPSVPPVVPSADDALPRDIGVRFGERLRELRKSRNMTQLRMSVDFGIDRSFISDVECGKKSISLSLLEVIALGLEIRLSDLLRGL
jgi:ribosome-binding protein aMBF1 (putative translation factor)